jgi:hypothetical protein
MPDRTWSPEVVKDIALGISTADAEGRYPHLGKWAAYATAALSASPLPDALDLIERMEKALKSYERYYEAGGNNIGFEAVAHSLAADAAAFVERVREG